MNGRGKYTWKMLISFHHFWYWAEVYLSANIFCLKISYQRLFVSYIVRYCETSKPQMICSAVLTRISVKVYNWCITRFWQLVYHLVHQLQGINCMYREYYYYDTSTLVVSSDFFSANMMSSYTTPISFVSVAFVFHIAFRCHSSKKN